MNKNIVKIVSALASSYGAAFFIYNSRVIFDFRGSYNSFEEHFILLSIGIFFFVLGLFGWNWDFKDS